MTIQSYLPLVWASDNTGVSDPGDTKYTLGWVSEIPTYQDFNFVLQTTTNNLLALAERGAFAWEPTISYLAGAEVTQFGKKYYAVADSLNVDPLDDISVRNYWNLSPSFGLTQADLNSSLGMQLYRNDGDDSVGTWNASSLSVTTYRPTIAFNTMAATDNFLLANVLGNMCFVNTGNVANPDGRTLSSGGVLDPGTFKIYHQGFKPVQADVAGTCPINPTNGKIVARMDGNWVDVSSTTMSIAPPPPVTGAGQFWYNLDDAQLYVDINDGDSSQWVPVSSPRAIVQDAGTTTYDNSGSGLLATDVESALDELANSGLTASAIQVTFDDTLTDLITPEQDDNVQQAIQSLWLRTEAQRSVYPLTNQVDLSAGISGLSSTNVQGALVELAARPIITGVGSTALTTTYTDTYSVGATTAQAGIDAAISRANSAAASVITGASGLAYDSSSVSLTGSNVKTALDQLSNRLDAVADPQAVDIEYDDTFSLGLTEVQDGIDEALFRAISAQNSIITGASALAYDSSSVSLTGSNVKTALDQLSNRSDVVKEAVDVPYNNTASGLFGGTVQQALDSLKVLSDYNAGNIIHTAAAMPITPIANMTATTVQAALVELRTIIAILHP